MLLDLAHIVINVVSIYMISTRMICVFKEPIGVLWLKVAKYLAQRGKTWSLSSSFDSDKKVCMLDNVLLDLAHIATLLSMLYASTWW